MASSEDLREAFKAGFVSGRADAIGDDKAFNIALGSERLRGKSGPFFEMAGIHGLGNQKMNPNDDQQRMQRRRTPRYPFLGGIAELTDASGQCLVAGTGQLSPFGCFVRTTTPLPAPAGLSLRLALPERDVQKALKILVVDDQEFVRRALHSLLAEQAHWQIYEAEKFCRRPRREKALGPRYRRRKKT